MLAPGVSYCPVAGSPSGARSRQARFSPDPSTQQLGRFSLETLLALSADIRPHILIDADMGSGYLPNRPVCAPLLLTTSSRVGQFFRVRESPFQFVRDGFGVERNRPATARLSD